MANPSTSIPLDPLTNIMTITAQQLEGQDSDSTDALDLSRERDELLQHFSKGSELTREFLDAYDRVQHQVQELQKQNAKLRATLEADNALQRLAIQITELESEKRQLLSQAAKLSERVASYPSRMELENELANLANLHVASNCLHSTLSPGGVKRRLKEVLEQLMGVETYAIHLSRPSLVPIAVEGFRTGESPEQLPKELMTDVVHAGVSRIFDTANPSQGSAVNPVALIPLKVDDKVVGLLCIVRTLQHKEQFSNLDFELFKLLGQHAAVALMAGGLYAQSGRTLPSADSFGPTHQ